MNYCWCLTTLRPRYSLVVDEDVKKPNKQTNKSYHPSSENGLSRPQVLRLISGKCYALSHRDSGETMAKED